MTDIQIRNGKPRFGQSPTRWLRQALVAGLLALGGCAISIPYKTVAAPPDSSATVVVALTWASLDPQRRAVFDRYTNRLVETLPQQPGLLGYSVRRELLGNEVWTMTVWSSDEARRNYVYSPLHQEAITETYGIIQRARFVRYVTTAAELPPIWPAALKRLEAAKDSY
jgi:quinol monooxygenase YgiN